MIFWKTKPLRKMTISEWESLCDGCGICCLEKIKDEDTGEIRFTAVTCEYLDNNACRCTIYKDRFAHNPDCIKLSPRTVKDFSWLPKTCAYRCLIEGRGLEWWHPLVSGDPNTVHRAGISIRNRSVSGKYVHPEDIMDFII